MTLGNIILAADLIHSLFQRAMKYQETIKTALAENRDLTDAELDALANETGLELELARKRILALKK